MALTRAQLLMGDSGQGTVLANQVRAVKPGAGILIGTDGVITVDSQTIVGVMKLGQTTAAATAAYNGYNWPSATGTPGQQITIQSVSGAVTTLAWGDPDQIPWTAKGQLVVGTGFNTQTVMSAGGNTSFLMADSGVTNGLIYSDSVTSAMQAPAGTTAQRPAGSPGQIRYNTTSKKFEFFVGPDWEEIASGNPVPGGNTFVKQSIPTSLTETGSAIIPQGSTAQRQTSPIPPPGSTRFNTTIGQIETWDGFTWGPAGGFLAGTRLVFVQSTAPLNWVKETGAAYNDAALRLVTGASGGSSGGSNPFTSTFTTYTPAGSFAGTIGNTTAGGSVAGSNAPTTAGGSVTGTNTSTTAGGTVTGTNDNTVAGGTVTGSVSSTTLTVAQTPSHAHPPLSGPGTNSGEFWIDSNLAGARGVQNGGSWSLGYGGSTTGYIGGDGAHTHALAAATFTGTAHTHTFNGSFAGAAHSHTWNGTYTGVAHDHVWSGTFTGTPHTHAVTGTVSGTPTSQFAVKYIDSIVCVKS
jgi:hypothetical protein